MSDIKFGTDGWRGRIADDYTYANVRRAAQAFASFLVESNQQDQKNNPSVVVGHDKRFSAEHFAATTAEVLAGNGLHVYLTQGATPTPVISFSAKNKGTLGAANITASHNPPEDCGFKVRDHNGGAIDPAGLARIEANIPAAGNEAA